MSVNHTRLHCVTNLPRYVNPIPTITIGTQTWMLKNVDLNIDGSKVYDDDESNRRIYGGLYTWAMISDIESSYTGWHVPTLAEWDVLLNYLGGKPLCGGKLKAVNPVWNSPNTGATNESKFTGLPAGGYYPDFSDFYELGEYGNFWLNSTFLGAPYATWLIYNSVAVGYDTTVPAYSYLSVRLIKD